MTQDNSKPKKKHNWMAGFIIPPRLTDEEHVARERAERCKAVWDTNNGYKRVHKQ